MFIVLLNRSSYLLLEKALLVRMLFEIFIELTNAVVMIFAAGTHANKQEVPIIQGGG